MAIPAWRVKLSSRPESQKIKSLAQLFIFELYCHAFLMLAAYPSLFRWVNNDDIS
jgi:hypothetical protein